MTHSTVLHNAQQGHETIERLWMWAKPRLIAGRKLVLSVGEQKRSKPQNDHIHPLVRAIGKAMQYPNEDRLRLLLVEQWRAETGRGKQFVPSIDGARMIDVSNSTKELDKPDAAEFIDWLHAQAAELGAEPLTP
jgi:hypothetical protein